MLRRPLAIIGLSALACAGRTPERDPPEPSNPSSAGETAPHETRKSEEPCDDCVMIIAEFATASAMVSQPWIWTALGIEASLRIASTNADASLCVKAQPTDHPDILSITLAYDEQPASHDDKTEFSVLEGECPNAVETFEVARGQPIHRALKGPPERSLWLLVEEGPPSEIHLRQVKSDLPTFVIDDGFTPPPGSAG